MVQLVVGLLHRRELGSAQRLSPVCQRWYSRSSFTTVLEISQCHKVVMSHNKTCDFLMSLSIRRHVTLLVRPVNEACHFYFDIGCVDQISAYLPALIKHIKVQFH